ncbi:hypothetical protein P43SY_004807 [Pythium insidiosum]|uniref:SH2 domain-containing protein n=1 Tax=Pythium insidiosum TaxID=114742 RepID=A0AAD5MAC1_PYTIN|nr:hypothetical protein P43SY_004807 [Pythium insidiosum]
MTIADLSASSTKELDGAACCSVCLSSTATFAHFEQGASGSPRHEAPAAPLGETAIAYQRTAQLKIFLSYGHDRFQLLAFHLKHALQQRGHSVWVDVEKLKAGIDWEDGINSALTWVKNAQHDGRVLLLMTPHALRRPDGYCLNEIARAASHRLAIFPVLVFESEPPPSIAMLPYFDLRDCVPTDADALALDAKSDAWRDRMRAFMHSEAFLRKSERLFAMLELFDSMTAYGVPAIAGVENLGLFAAFEASHHRDARAASLHRLLSQRSSDSLLCASAEPSPTAAAVSPQSITLQAKAPSETNVLALAASNAPPAAEQDAAAADAAETERLALQVRYMFSFDDSCFELARRLHADLAALGFQVCAPPPPPVAGDAASLEASRRAHEDALAWAAAEKNGKMVLLVTPESVGRPSGVCLNDISAAMAAGLGFVPLMVRQCEIPLSICRIQWLDLSDALVYAASAAPAINEPRYAARRDQLVTALKGKLDHEGQQARLFSLLAPFSFQQQISQRTARFAGRDWLFDALRQWLDAPSASAGAGAAVFWITGPIGSGKTSAAARMVQSLPEIAACHFALPEDEQTHSARRCVLSLAFQLTTQLPEYTAFLQAGEPLEEIVPVSSVQALLTHLLVTPLNAIARPANDKPLLLLLDGLEHLVAKASGSSSGAPPTMAPTPARRGSRGRSDDCLVSLLPSLVARLPSWVRVVLLSREDHAILLRLQGLSPNVALDRHMAENDADIRAFVEGALRATPAAAPEHVELIARRSEGLFLYAVNIVQSIEDGRLALDQLASLPLGMGGYLRQFFDSHFDDAAYTSKIRPVLEVVCAAYEPLAVETLASVLQLSAYEQHEFATAFGALLYVADDGCLRPFHSSVLEWVQDVRTAGRFFADVASGHERLGLWAAREYDAIVQRSRNEFVNLNYDVEGSTGSDQQKTKIYIVRHAINHLMQAKGDECMRLVGRFAADETFQLARRLLSLRFEGLESFFHGDITRERSQELLATNARPGSFLIRYSARQKSYCASFIERLDAATGAPKFRHNLIYHLKTGPRAGTYSVQPPEQVTEQTVVFPDLVSFVEEYQRKGILCAAIPRASPLNRAISTPVDAV